MCRIFFPYRDKFSSLLLFLLTAVVPLIFDVRSFRNFIYPKLISLYFIGFLILILNFNEIHFYLKKTKKIAPFISFFLVSIIVSFHSVNPYLSIRGMVLFIMFSFSYLLILKKFKEYYFFKKWLFFLSFIVIAVCVYGILQFFGIDFISFSQKKVVISFLGNPNYVGQFLDIPFALFISESLRKKTKKVYRYYFFLISFLCFLTVILASCKGSIIAMLIITIIVFFYYKVYKIFKLKNWLIIIIIFLVFSLLFNNLLVEQISELMSKSIHSNKFRLASYKAAIKIIRDNPFGIGILNFIEVAPLYLSETYWQINNDFRTRRPLYVHNDFLQITAETGIIGLFFFLLSLYVVLKKGFSEKNFKISCAFGVICMLLHSFVSFPFYNYPSAVIFYIVISFIM